MTDVSIFVNVFWYVDRSYGIVETIDIAWYLFTKGYSAYVYDDPT